MPAPAMDVLAFTGKASVQAALRPRRDVSPIIRKGLRGRYPARGERKMYLKGNDICPHCGKAVHRHGADDTSDR